MFREPWNGDSAPIWLPRGAGRLSISEALEGFVTTFAGGSVARALTPPRLAVLMTNFRELPGVGRQLQNNLRVSTESNFASAHLDIYC